MSVSQVQMHFELVYTERAEYGKRVRSSDGSALLNTEVLHARPFRVRRGSE
jgi:hypothetical protein